LKKEGKLKDAREKKTIFFVASDFFKQIIISEDRDDNGKKKEIFYKNKRKKNGKILFSYQNCGGNPPLSSTVKVKTEFFIQS
jgi:hypothetical protein